MVNIDGMSNRLAAMCYGPRHVLYIIGMNKAVSSPEERLSAGPDRAAPINAMRFDLDTPCRNTGCCYDCQSPDTICCQILITRHSRIPGRAKGHSGGGTPGVLIPKRRPDKSAWASFFTGFSPDSSEC